MLNRFTIGLVLTLIGMGVVWSGLLEQSVAEHCSQIPEEISLQQLLARGPNGNSNIILTDFSLCDYFVYELGSHVWIPIVPGKIDQTAGRPPVVHALLYSTNVRNQTELKQRFAQPKLPAMVANKLILPIGDERDLLQKSYPGTNLDRCRFIEEGREPPDPTAWKRMIGIGVAAVVGGVLLVLWSVIRLVKRLRS